jgi:hypothetical protein
VERLHLGRGFEVSGEVELDEVAVPGQRPDLLDGFLLGDSELRRAADGKGVFTQTAAELRGEFQPVGRANDGLDFGRVLGE